MSLPTWFENFLQRFGWVPPKYRRRRQPQRLATRVLVPEDRILLFGLTDDAYAMERNSVPAHVLVLANDNSISGPLEITGFSQPTTGGSVSLLDNPHGPGTDQLIYTPSENYTGGVYFTYTAQDATGSQGSANVNVTVSTGSGSGSGSSAGYDSGSTYSTGSGYGSGSSSSSGYSSGSGYGYGSSSGSSSSSDSSSGGSGSGSGSSSGSNTIPTPHDDWGGTRHDRIMTGDVAVNDELTPNWLGGWQDYEGDTITFLVDSGPSHGALSLDALTGQFTYQPDTHYVGTDSFTYKLSDSNLTSVYAATVSLGIFNSVPDPQDDAYLVFMNGELEGNVSANDYLTTDGAGGWKDYEGDQLLFQLIDSPASGEFEFNATTGEFSYSPEDGNMDPATRAIACRNQVNS